MKKVVKFIYNPWAGENKILSYLDNIIDAYQKKGYQISPFRIGNNALEDAFDDGVEYEQILVAGGDGTVNSLVNVMKKLGVNAPLAILPVGTANDLAKLIGFSSNIQTAINQILNGRVEEIDLGIANDVYFTNVLSTGLFTDISQKTPTILKNTFGKLAYYMTTSISSLQELPKFKKIHINITSDDIHFDDNSLILFVFNGRTAGNMKLAYLSDIQDGMLDVLIIKGDNIAETIKTAFHFLSGVETKYPSGVIHFKTKEIIFNSNDNIVVDLDGEAGPQTPMTIRCIEKGIKLIVPQH